MSYNQTHDHATSVRPRVLLNIVRLLPEGKGAGGAGRLVIALLTHLLEHVDLRVAIAPHSEYLLRRFPDLEFVIVSNDANAQLEEHLEWCQCYIDPLNGLRPTHIDSKIAVISMVLDLQHMEMPWFFSESEIQSRIAEYSYAINRSDQLVAISEYERDNFRRYYGIDRVTVMHLAGFMAEDSGVSRDEVTAWEIEKDNPYLIYPAVPWQHKNHEILIQAVGVLNRRGVKVPVVLTNTGGRADMKKKLADIAEAHGVGDLVTLQAYLPESELFALFTRSTGMVFPTLYEGFGIPLVDAMTLGVPVLTTRTSAVPEICGEAASYFSNANNVLAIADELEAFWTDPKRWSEQRQRGFDQADRFSSKKMAINLLEAIHAALARKKTNDQMLARQGKFSPPRYNPLSVLILYGDLSEEDRAWLCSLPDLHAWHISKFGHDADITVALDISLSTDDALKPLFKRLPKVILYDASDMKSINHAVLDFSTRYDQSEMQIVVKFDSERLNKYSADRMNLAVLCIGLHTDAGYAIFDDKIEDCIIDDIPSERQGVHLYDSMYRYGTVIFDTIIKRSHSAELRNGSSQYLSRLCTELRRLRVPVG